jgi:hypothetical protein
MERLPNKEQDVVPLKGDWERAGEYLSTALREVAGALGGEEFAAKIAETARVADSTWPNPEALRRLEESYPGSAETVMSRAEAIQQETHERELG